MNFCLVLTPTTKLVATDHFSFDHVNYGTAYSYKFSINSADVRAVVMIPRLLTVSYMYFFENSIKLPAYYCCC